MRVTGSVSSDGKNSERRMPIAYIVSMRAGMEAFIYREIEALYSRGYSITLFATRFKAGDIFSPRPEWPYHVLPFGQLLIRFPVLLLKMLMRPRLLVEAIRDQFCACHGQGRHTPDPLSFR